MNAENRPDPAEAAAEKAQGPEGSEDHLVEQAGGFEKVGESEPPAGAEDSADDPGA